MESYEVAIVGGGISGLYCAKKLRDNGIEGIVVLEKTDRWGGRLNTDLIEMNNRIIKDEKGAMRFTYKDPDKEPKSNMPLLTRLIKDMDMESQVEPFFMEPQPSPSSSAIDVADGNSNFYGCRHFTNEYAEQNPHIWGDLYGLSDEKEMKSPGQIVNDVYLKLLNQNRDKVRQYFESLDRADVAEKVLTQSDVQILQEHQDQNYWTFFRNEFEWPVGLQMTKMRDVTVLTLLRAMGYSDECCSMMVKAQFLYEGKNVVSQADAGCLLQCSLNSASLHDNLSHFKSGWSSLVEKIKHELESENRKVELIKNCEVDEIHDDGEGYTLEMSSLDKKIRARRVVMAIPPGAVKTLFSKSEMNLHGHYEPVVKLCDTVVGVDLLKVVLYFEHDWWNQQDNTVLFGSNWTDLECGSIYPYYGKCRTNCTDSDNCDGVPRISSLTIYCGASGATFWRNCQRLGRRFESPLQKEYNNLIPASETLISEALEQVKKIFNVEEIPSPILTSYRSWNGGGEYGHGYHHWCRGVDDQNLEVTQPIEGKNLYFCTEAWSSFQGYVEGSLLSTKKVVDRILSNPY